MSCFTRLVRATLLLTLASASALSLSAQTVNTIDPALKAKIDRIAAGVLEQHGVPSASIAVIQHGKIVFTQAYGLAHIGPDEPATPEMRYSIGSISKQFTAAAILLLQEQGKLKLDDPVGKYVPDLTRGNEITIRQVLSHTSGYQDYWPEDYLMTPMMKPTTAQYILDTWAKKPLDFEPGTQWQYSNTNFVIAGMIVEKVSGQKLVEFLGEHIFHPLGMKSVYDSDQDKLTSTDATAYIRAALAPLRAAPKEGRNWMFAAGELAMTPHDLALWNESLIAQSILKPESYKEMFTSIKLKGGPKDGQDSHYGLGIFVRKYDGHLLLEHSGEVTGFVAESMVFPDDGVSVIVLTNHMESGASQIATTTADTLIGLKQSAPEEQAFAIYRDLQQGKIDRSLLAPNLSDYFDAQTLEDFKTSLSPLGEPLTFTQTGESLRGGMTERSFRIVYPTRRLSLSTYTYPDGKLEQYLVNPAD
ncbi:serine hydrolase domain-containing protein [Terracidiphilus sp.]|jgi:CubicO group peptidase (beta-lactamase class C family)|uniref:serine hydrolase domain-containing protein n=1 Tax=Terracidiphilus sp. TaxID=1964191 RepID=UPI003C1B7AD4